MKNKFKIFGRFLRIILFTFLVPYLIKLLIVEKPVTPTRIIEIFPFLMFIQDVLPSRYVVYACSNIKRTLSD